MLFSRSSLPLVALTSCISTVVAGPIHSSLSKRGKNVLIGYRYVSEDQAEEYNTYGRLTAVGSSSTQLGEGAYIYPSLNEFVVPEEYWQCTIFADHDKFRQAKKMYIPQTSNTFFSSRRLERYLSEAMMDATSTVLFSKIDGDPQEHIQMMLPPYYLERSPKFHGAFGEGDLGISVKCLPKEQANYFGNASWGATWRIPGYGCDFLVRRDGNGASCPMPSPVGPIEVPSSLLPSPSANISTVASYSATTTTVTVTSTALPSGMSFLPSGSSSALPPPVSGLSSGSIISASVSSFSFPAPIPSSVSNIPVSSAPSSVVSQSNADTPTSSGPISLVASSSVPASLGQTSAVATPSASLGQASSAPSTSSAASSVLSSSVPSSASAFPDQSSAVARSSATPVGCNVVPSPSASSVQSSSLPSSASASASSGAGASFSA